MDSALNLLLRVLPILADLLSQLFDTFHIELSHREIRMQLGDLPICRLRILINIISSSIAEWT